MSCDEIKNKLSAFMDNELSKDDLQKVQKHLLNCSKCQSELRLLQKMEKFYIEENHEFEVSEEVNQRIMKEVIEISKRVTFFKKISTFSIAASTIAAILLGAFVANFSFTETETNFDSEFNYVTLYSYVEGAQQ